MVQTRLRAAIAFFAFVLLMSASASHALPIRVRGASEIDLLVSEVTGGIRIRGEVLDEMGASLGRVTLKIELLDASGQPIKVNGPLDTPLGCVGSEAPTKARADGSSYAVTTDERGGFCVLAAGGHRPTSVRASFAGTKHVDGAEVTANPVPESEQRAQVTLRFEAPPANLDLDKETHPLTLSVKISRADASRLFLDATKKQGLPLTLEDERGTQLGTASSGGDGRARFELKSTSLAPPGDGELKVSFAGDAQLMPAKTSIQITRTATAQLDAPSSVHGDPEGGLTIEVKVQSDRGTVEGGLVEALVGTDPVGTGKVEGGVAKVVVTFPGGASARVPVTLRFVPSTPFWQAGPPTKVTVVVAGPSPLRQIVLAVAVVVLAGWIVAKWRRSPKQNKPETVALPPPSGRPEIVVLDRPSGLRGWRGFVTDAHDGHPIANAELRVVVASFEGRGELARAHSDAEGAFSIELADVPRDARLVVDGELHATYEQPLPGPSVLRVALVTRRRALLDRLVRWARQRGAPFDSPKEPTPGHVRRVASRTGNDSVESWASQLEQVAFGAEDVTREVENELAHREPHAQVASPAGPPRAGGPGPEDQRQRFPHEPLGDG